MNYEAYLTMSARIKACKGRESLNSAQRSLDRLYAAGVLSVAQYRRLDVKIMERIALED
jgi:hypothetical protein